MIIEVPVICALALHVLFYVKEGSLPFLELFVKQLQLSPCPFHTIPVAIHLDFSGFGQGEFGLTEPEGLCKGDDLAFSFVHTDSSGFKPPYQLTPKFLQFFHIGQDHIVIIHVMTGTVNTGLAFDPVINFAGH